MHIVLFEDDAVARLAPVTLGRPAMAISCGSKRLVDLVGELGRPVHALVRPHLVGIVKADFPQLASVVSDPAALPQGPALRINARLVPSVAAAQKLKRMLEAARGRVLADEGPAPTGEGAPVNHQTAVAAEVVTAGTKGEDSRAADAVDESDLARLAVFRWPHDVIRAHLATLGDHLAARIASGQYRELEHGVFAAADVQLGQYVVTDTSAGPIVLDEGASVGPMSLLAGPCYLGKNCRVNEHAAIKHGTALGHTTKIGGEVEASIIEPYSNKQHHGFLGHSYLGSWVNLGAGTSNSDLKNTYGQVNMEYDGLKVPSGMQFVGAILGDYVKTAINTGIFTGKVVGACSMLYGFVTTNVPSFVNYARLFAQVSEAPVEVLVATQRRMFARRGVEQRPCDIQLLHDMHALTASERARMAGPLTIEPLSL